MNATLRRPSAETHRSTILNLLPKSPLFCGLEVGELVQVARIAVAKTLSKGEYLFFEGGVVHGFYIVIKGSVKVYRVNFMGKEQVINICRPFESFAEDALFSDIGHSADACATELTTVLLFPKSEFDGLLKRHPELSLRLLRSVSEHVRSLIGLLDDLTLKDIKTRLATWLIQHCPQPNSYKPQSIHLPMTKRLLASELGTTSETFSRTLAKLRDEQLVSVEGNTVTLQCPVKLVEYLQSHAGSVPSTETFTMSGSSWNGSTLSPKGNSAEAVR
ncbi:MAG: Crp/Fnr family transcriptional regulator [Verrucomicrobia bacterium]|nr:Crp/Fnr family transcriptional regulator [Verrucomicrobiota bacterium]